MQNVTDHPPSLPAHENSSAAKAGSVPLAVVLISLNEAHNMPAVLDEIVGWAQEIFLIDSFSSDDTVDIALRHGVHVVQRPFRGFGDQWNYAMDALPVTAPWTMKLDPDERLTATLKASIEAAIMEERHDALYVQRRMWFMGQPMPVRQETLRLWRTGTCRFSDVAVDEQPLVDGREILLQGELEHHDSPNMHHWFDKQNRYTTASARAVYLGDGLSVPPRLFGSALERRMWLKRHYTKVPFRHQLMFLYCLIVKGAWRAGRVGVIWSKARADVHRTIEIKALEMKWTDQSYDVPPSPLGLPNPGAIQAEPHDRFVDSPVEPDN